MLYFHTTDVSIWNYKAAAEEYINAFGQKAKEVITSDLKQLVDNVNSRSIVKRKAEVFLERIDSYFTQDENQQQSSSTASPSSSTANHSNTRGNINNIQNIYNNNNGANSSSTNLISNYGNNTMSASTPANSNKRRKIFEDDDDDDSEYATEVTEMFQLVQDTPAPTSDDNDLLPQVMLRNTSLSIKQPNYSLLIDNVDGTSFNFTSKFQQYQNMSIDKCNNGGLLLETHPFNILSLSSILLVKPNQYPEDLLNYFSLEELDSVKHHILTCIAGTDYEDISFDPELYLKIINIVKAYMKRDGKKITCIKELTLLLDEESIDQTNIILSLINYVECLPDIKMNCELGEIELCLGYLNPLLFNLFHSDSSILRWANKITSHSQVSSENVNKKRRPDAIISVMKQNKYLETRGFGEVKTEEGKKDAYLLTRDLVRLGIFSKQCIDCDDMNANINFQAVGSSVCFYLNTLLTDGVYCLTEVANIKVPMAKSELLNYVNQFDKLMLITEVYKRSCIKSSMPIPSEIKRQTLDSPAFRSYINSKSSRGASTQLLFN